MMMTPDVDAYLAAISPHATNQLKLQERTVSTLRGFHYDNDSSRIATAVTLRTIQAELARLAQTVNAVRAPARLALASAAHARAIQQLGSAAGELGQALRGEPAARVQRIERALGLAREAERSARASAESTSAALGAAATTTAASIPIIGSIIGAILSIIAAIIVVIAALLSKVKEQDAAAQERRDSGGAKPKRRP